MAWVILALMGILSAVKEDFSIANKIKILKLESHGGAANTAKSKVKNKVKSVTQSTPRRRKGTQSFYCRDIA